MQNPRLSIRQRFDFSKTFGAAAFHHIRRERPRRAGKTNERDFVAQFLAQFFDDRATKGTSVAGSGMRNASTSRAARIGLAISGPLSVSSTPTPMASTGIRMSEKKMTASTPRIRSG